VIPKRITDRPVRVLLRIPTDLCESESAAEGITRAAFVAAALSRELERLGQSWADETKPLPR